MNIGDVVNIEVDTYFNDGQDPTPLDHLMFTFDGDVDDPVPACELLHNVTVVSLYARPDQAVTEVTLS